MQQLDKPQPSEADEVQRSLSMIQVFGSILASFYGVQSSSNRQRDFQRGKAKHFIAAGIVMTAVWYAVIYLVVTIVLQNTG